MQAARFLGEGRIDIVEREPAQPVPGNVHLDILACALCGSGLRGLKNGWPVTPGHEIVGRVNQPSHAAHGRRALAYIPLWCGQCAWCIAGETHLCDRMGDRSDWQTDGEYADSTSVPAQCLLFVPDDIPDHLAPLMLDTIGTPAHGLRLAKRIANAGPVAVLGAGPIACYSRQVDSRVPLAGLETHFGEFARGERLKPQFSTSA